MNRLHQQPAAAVCQAHSVPRFHLHTILAPQHAQTARSHALVRTNGLNYVTSLRTRCSPVPALPSGDEVCTVTQGVGAVEYVLALAGAAALPWVGEKVYDLLKPRKCQTCYGAGFYPCTVCGGRGKTGGLVSTEPLEVCSACRGSGKGRCRTCDGTGLANGWLWKPTENPGWGARGE